MRTAVDDGINAGIRTEIDGTGPGVDTVADRNAAATGIGVQCNAAVKGGYRSV